MSALYDIIKDNMMMVMSMHENYLKEYENFVGDDLVFIKVQIALMKQSIRNENDNVIVTFKNASRLASLYRLSSTHASEQASKETDEERHIKYLGLSADFEETAIKLETHKDSMYRDMVHFRSAMPEKMNELAEYM